MTVDNNVWSCAGGTAAFDMMVVLVENLIVASLSSTSSATRSGRRGECGELAVAGRIRAGDERQRLPLLRQHGRLNPRSSNS
ncbi:hypothetical protein NKI25_31125 [Mesorhizobium sp. M0808]|uniref:hypothetical protein n=1 Tax=Mesorhizobium sp. M0808 TaxID=2957002 RepID=UPI00333A2F09